MLPFLGRVGYVRVVVPGSQDFTIPGTFQFIVPEYDTLTVDVRGAGGGGSNNAPTGHMGTAGGDSSIAELSLYAYGGARGPGGNGDPQQSPLPAGASGGASGGDINTVGGGAAGGRGGYYSQYSLWLGGPGGYGGRAQKTIHFDGFGAPPPGTVLTVVIGAGGSAAPNTSGYVALPGGNGSSSISWA